jgi:hypothetical protein
MNRPNFFPFPQRKKEIKERTVSTRWQWKEIFLFFIIIILYVMVHDCLRERDGESLLFEAYPKLAQEPKYYVHTYITRAVFRIP